MPSETAVAITAVKAQNALLDLQIKLCQDSILRLDSMIDECAKIKRDLQQFPQQ